MIEDLVHGIIVAQHATIELAVPAPLCPHCHAQLPEQASFCGACGRRIEGWRQLPATAEESAAPPSLPGSQEATRQMEPTPSLLRVAKLSRDQRQAERARKATPAPVESESMMLRALKKPRVPPWLALGLVACACAAGGFLVMKRQQRRAATVAPPPATPSSPAVPPSGSVAPPQALAAAPAVAAPIAPLPASRAKHRQAHRLTALEVPIAQKPVKAAKGGGLPHKAVSTDSRPAQAVNTRTTQSPPSQGQIQDPYPTVTLTPPPQAPPQQLAMPTAPHEAPASPAEPPPTEAEQKQEAQARIDADGVRLVVKQHLPQVHACYGRAFKESSPGGRIEIGFAINQSGRAEGVRTEVNTTDSVELARCLEQRLREWQFPRPVGGDYDLVYPFVFAPGS
jgi:hypothetical protein